MFEKLKSVLSRIRPQFITNEGYLLLLAFFSFAVLMNNGALAWKKPVALALLLLLCGLLLLKLRLWWTSVGVIVINIFLYISLFPRTANHPNLELFSALLLLLLIAYKWYDRRLYLQPTAVSLIFRITVVTVYFLTGFHKLNTDFFDPCVSCVNHINEIAPGKLAGTPFRLSAEISRAIQILTLFLEMILPFGLLCAATRKWAAITILCFHFYLSFIGFADFGAFAAFLILGCMIDFTKTQQHHKILMAFRVYAVFTLIAVIIKPIGIWLQISSTLVNFIHGFVYNIGYALFFIIFFKNYTAHKYIWSRTHLLPALVCIVLLGFWSLKAYAGLGNSANLTMFSNLLTEQSRSNHLIVDTRYTKLTDFEEDNVLVLELHDTLKKERLEGFRVPVVEFCFLAKQYTERYPAVALNCRLVYRNDTIAIADLKQSRYSQTKWWYKYLFFRKIQPDGPNACYW